MRVARAGRPVTTGVVRARRVWLWSTRPRRQLPWPRGAQMPYDRLRITSVQSPPTIGAVNRHFDGRPHCLAAPSSMNAALHGLDNQQREDSCTIGAVARWGRLLGPARWAEMQTRQEGGAETNLHRYKPYQ